MMNKITFCYTLAIKCLNFDILIVFQVAADKVRVVIFAVMKVGHGSRDFVARGIRVNL